MVRFLPEKITSRELRALERLSGSVDITDMAPVVQRRLELLGFAQRLAEGLLITVDGMLQLEIKKEENRRAARQ